jgi:hypothetical protein
MSGKLGAETTCSAQERQARRRNGKLGAGTTGSAQEEARR